jgi:tetratricopeptide (TPR) repeat protein
MVRPFAFAAVLVAFSSLALFADDLTSEDYVIRGNASAKEGAIDKAIGEYNEAIRLDPQYAQAFYNRGIAWYGKGELDKAIKDFNDAIKIDPN